MSEYRPRLPERLESIIETHAEEHGKTKPEMLAEMIDAYDNGITSAHGTLEANNSLLSDIHKALDLNAQTTIESPATEDIESENGTRNNINYNALSMNHNMEFGKNDESWALLWEQGVIKHSPKYLIPIIQGFINKYAHGDTISLQVFDQIVFRTFNLSEHTERKYKYEYGPRHDVWVPAPYIDPKFSLSEVYAETIRRMARNAATNAPDTTESKEEKRLLNKYDDFDDLFDFKFKFTDDDGNTTTESIWDDEKQFFYSHEQAEESLLELLDNLKDLATGYGSRPGIIRILYDQLTSYGIQREFWTADRAADLNDELEDYINEN